MAVWAEALATGELLDPAMQAQRLSWYLTQDPNAKYGLGVVDINGLVGHNGEISGYMSRAARRETDGTIIVVLTNLTMAPDTGEPATVISEMISRAIRIAHTDRSARHRGLNAALEKYCYATLSEQEKHSDSSDERAEVTGPQRLLVSSPTTARGSRSRSP